MSLFNPFVRLFAFSAALLLANANASAQSSGTESFGKPMAGQTEVASTDAVHNQLTASHHTVTPGQTIGLAWDITLDPAWHVYWSNPGDSGLPPILTTAVPGASVASLTFPTPHLISIPPVTNYGYENRVILTTSLTVPANQATGMFNLPLKLTYLYCSDVCMPGEVYINLPLDIASQALENPAFASLIQVQAATLPQALPQGLQLQAQTSSNTMLLKGLPQDATSARFIPKTEGWLHDSAEQPLKNGTLTLTADPFATSPQPTVLEGILLLNGTGHTLKLPVTAAPAPTAQTDENLTLPLAAFFAFLAGLILNLMPCVLPVLALKLLSLIKQHTAQGRVRHSLAYTAGILASFWVFAVIISVLQAGGAGLGWGFHLQNPTFVAVLAALMLTLALNFFGLFEMGARFTRLSGQPETRSSLSGSFGTGILAVVVATPCTAPFMGGAMAYALNQGWLASGAVFTALGLGLAAPFLLITVAPGLVRWLPRPGSWMLTLKHALGWPMLATSLWLLWVFANQTGINATFLLLASLLLLALALWLYGRSPRGIILSLVVLALLAGGVLAQRALTPSPLSKTHWQPWSANAVTQALTEGRPVFVDFTADWCLTCKVTQATVLNTDRVQQMFARHNVAAFQGDWTRQDASITTELARHGRKGVPLYLAWPAGAATPTVLPQLLTPGLLEDIFKKRP